jgi:hypothetical protein
MTAQLAMLPIQRDASLLCLAYTKAMMTSQPPPSTTTVEPLNLALLGQLYLAYEAHQADTFAPVTLSLPELAQLTGAKSELVKKRLLHLRLLELVLVVGQQPKGYQWNPFAHKHQAWLSPDDAMAQAGLLAALADWTPEAPVPLAKKWRR